jgi:oligopeptide transport system permease protein
MAVDRREAALPTAPPAVGAGATLEEPSAGAPIAQASLWKDAWYRYVRNKAAVAAGAFFIILVLYCLLIPGFWKIPGIWTSLKDYDPNHVDFSQSYAGFSLDHPFSTDKFGRDLFARTAVGGQISIAIGFAATFFILVIGVVYGSISGFAGGFIDNIMMRFLDALYGLPYLPFAIITLAIFGTVNFWTMVVALTVASWFTTARVMRGQIITLKENDYVRAANALGARWYRVLFRHLLPNTLGVILIFVFLELPGVVLGEAFLSFIGLGISPPKSSWGSLALDGYSAYEAHPYIIVIPSLAIGWLILSAFFVADGLRDALDPRTRET